MPHFRARVEGMDMQDVDAAMHEAQIGAVAGGDVDNAAQASGTPGGDPKLQGVTVTVQGEDEADAQRRLAGALGPGASIEILG